MRTAADAGFDVGAIVLFIVFAVFVVVVVRKLLRQKGPEQPRTVVATQAPSEMAPLCRSCGLTATHSGSTIKSRSAGALGRAIGLSRVYYLAQEEGRPVYCEEHARSNEDRVSAFVHGLRARMAAFEADLSDQVAAFLGADLPERMEAIVDRGVKAKIKKYSGEPVRVLNGAPAPALPSADAETQATEST